MDELWGSLKLGGYGKIRMFHEMIDTEAAPTFLQDPLAVAVPLLCFCRHTW